jgi:hypothetical protein
VLEHGAAYIRRNPRLFSFCSSCPAPWRGHLWTSTPSTRWSVRLVRTHRAAGSRTCPVYRMVEWPLPRYSSHLVDCPVLIARRLEEAEIRMEQMRYAAAARKHNREAKQRRMEAWEARFEDPFGKEN